LSIVCVVFCQVEVSATSLSLVQEESYRLWRGVVCDQETALRCTAREGVKNNNNYFQVLLCSIYETIISILIKFRLGSVHLNE
jgi:hypothetical protein